MRWAPPCSLLALGQILLPRLVVFPKTEFLGRSCKVGHALIFLMVLLHVQLLFSVVVHFSANMAEI